MESKVREQTREYIKSHEKMSYDKFVASSGIKINECYYYQIRRSIYPQGTRVSSKPKSHVFVNLISLPNKGLSLDTKKAISDIINAINTAKGSRMEIVENIQEGTIEIREMGA